MQMLALLAPERINELRCDYKSRSHFFPLLVLNQIRIAIPITHIAVKRLISNTIVVIIWS